jgi:curli biogenesis system outer membrane secretion channel CsgG
MKIILSTLLLMMSFQSLAVEKTIAVLDFKYKDSQVVISEQFLFVQNKESKTDIISDAVSSNLAKTRKVKVLDRGSITELVLEKEFIGSENTFTGADFLVTGSIIEFNVKSKTKKIPYTDIVRTLKSFHVVVKYKVIDPGTSEILLSDVYTHNEQVNNEGESDSVVIMNVVNLVGKDISEKIVNALSN